MPSTCHDDYSTARPKRAPLANASTDALLSAPQRFSSKCRDSGRRNSGCRDPIRGIAWIATLLLSLTCLTCATPPNAHAADPPTESVPDTNGADTNRPDERGPDERGPGERGPEDRDRNDIEDLVATLRESLQQGDWDRAAEDAARIAEEPSVVPDPARAPVTMLLARIARSIQRDGRSAAAAEVFRATIAVDDLAIDRGSADSDGLTTRQRLLIRLAAASLLNETGNLTESVHAIEPVSATLHELETPERDAAVKWLIEIGSKCLRDGKPEVARKAYKSAAETTDLREVRATAALGAAWALATLGSDPEPAAEELMAFTDAFPEHVDAPRAARAAATCLAQAGRADEADLQLIELLDRWPRSHAALDIVSRHADVPTSQLPDRIVDWLLDWAPDAGRADATPGMLAFGLRVAAERGMGDAESTFAGQLAVADRDGRQTAELLKNWNRDGQIAIAERVAARYISPSPDTRGAAAVREAACLWAGRAGRWSMLAVASESETPSASDGDPDHDTGSDLDESQHRDESRHIDESRSITVERLFAEALTQTGRPAEARVWWKHLVDVRRTRDFPTLLRCAETSTPIAEVAEATERIEAAREAAEEDPARLVLVEALSAELAIRRARFDDARGRLESIVRDAYAPPALRGRAQWLIGETHYLQQRFPDAIEAYRRVEGVDEGGAWVPAALIQAGKSFEQLGRTREATVCYVTLMQRFSDSEHAPLARRRLATLSPDPSRSSPDPNSRSGTLRR